MTIKKHSLACVISLIAMLHGCGGGDNKAPSESTPSGTAQAQSWGTSFDDEGLYGQSQQYFVLRSWRDTTGQFTGHLVVAPGTGLLTMMNADFSIPLVVLSDIPAIEVPETVQWIAPNFSEAGILLIGNKLYRFAWDGKQATISKSIYTLQQSSSGSDTYHQVVTDQNGIAIRDANNLVLISANGTLKHLVDLSQALGVISPSYGDMAMNDQELLVLADHGLLSIDRGTGQTHWVDHFDGTYAVNQILWANNGSIGYRIHMAAQDQWWEQVIERSSSGEKRLVADRVIVPQQDLQVEQSHPHKQTGAFNEYQVGAFFPKLTQGFPATHRLDNSHVYWCSLPQDAGQWTCKNQQLFSYLPATQTTTDLGTLVSVINGAKPESMMTGHDATIDGHYIDLSTVLADVQPPSFQNEVWTFDPNIAHSLHPVVNP